MWNYQNTDELYHYGVMGMKWGVRRYQNADGTYNSAGKARYLKDKTSNKKQSKEKYSKKWDKKIQKEESKIANKIEKYTDSRKSQRSKSNTGKVYNKINTKLSTDPDIIRYTQLSKAMNNKRQVTLNEMQALQNAYNKASKARIKIIQSHQQEMTEAALKDLGYTPTKQSAKKYTDIIKNK